jgi:SAM-dependent methyltransferase
MTTSRLHRLAAPPSVLAKRDTIEAAARRNGLTFGRVLNVGSKNIRIGDTCVNLDIAPGPGVDIVGDAHDLAARFGRNAFDSVVLSAVLQYCRDPRRVITEAAGVLTPGGWLVIDAPYLQPNCYDGADLWRFTADGLAFLCEPDFEIVDLTVSIATGPAIAYIAQTAARRTKRRSLALILGWTVSLALWPLRFLPMTDPGTAGAFLLVARKRTVPMLNAIDQEPP